MQMHVCVMRILMVSGYSEQKSLYNKELQYIGTVIVKE